MAEEKQAVSIPIVPSPQQQSLFLRDNEAMRFGCCQSQILLWNSQAQNHFMSFFEEENEERDQVFISQELPKNQHQIPIIQGTLRSQLKKVQSPYISANIEISTFLSIDYNQYSEKDSINRYERLESVKRYLEKRNRRVWKKKVSYHKRKTIADERPRVKGRFIKGDKQSQTFQNASNQSIELA